MFIENNNIRVKTSNFHDIVSTGFAKAKSQLHLSHKRQAHFTCGPRTEAEHHQPRFGEVGICTMGARLFLVVDDVHPSRHIVPTTPIPDKSLVTGSGSRNISVVVIQSETLIHYIDFDPT